MADSLVLARFKASLMPKAAPPKPRPAIPYTPEERAQVLMWAVTMAEIRAAASVLGMTFKAAYRERERLYATRPALRWQQIIGVLGPRAET